jgi:thymidylate kinase
MFKPSQDEAIKQIHFVANKANLCVFILCDDDLAIKEADHATKFTEDEKEDIYCEFHEGLSQVYDEILDHICNNIIENR